MSALNSLRASWGRWALALSSGTEVAAARAGRGSRVLNAPQLLQASMVTSLPPALALAAFAAGAFAGAFFAGAFFEIVFFGAMIPAA